MQPHFEHQLEAARRLYNNDTYLRCSKKLIVFLTVSLCVSETVLLKRVRWRTL